MRRRSLGKQHLRKQLGFEALEAKEPLAADVLATVVGGTNLLIEGNNLANRLVLSGTPATGLQLSAVSGSATLIDVDLDNDGTPEYTDESSFQFFNITGDVEVDLLDNSGSMGIAQDAFELDATVNGRFSFNVDGLIDLTINDSTISAGAEIDLGDGGFSSIATIISNSFISGGLLITGGGGGGGHDVIINGNTSVSGDLIVSFGDADTNSLELTDVEVGDDLKVSAGSQPLTMAVSSTIVGQDAAIVAESVLQLELAEFSVGDDAIIIGGSSKDIVGIDGLTVGDKLRVLSRSGDDEVSLVNVHVGNAALVSLGQGSDTTELVSSTFGYGLTILGKGGNEIALESVTTSHYIDIVTTSGADLVDMIDVETHTAWISLGAGDDELSISESAFDYLFALLGSGDDVVVLDDVTIDRFAVISGGPGADTLELDAATADELLFYFGFETVDMVA